MKQWLIQAWKTGIEDWRDDRISDSSMALIAAVLPIIAAVAWTVDQLT